MRDAYLNGKRTGAEAAKPRAMRIPRHLRIEDDRGREMAVLLGPPTWGEADAGMWWGQTFHKYLLDMGWMIAEGVPCVYYFRGEASAASLLTKVDDFLVSEDEGHFEVTDATFAALRAAAGTARSPQRRERGGTITWRR